jgi:hypothetical protein
VVCLICLIRSVQCGHTYPNQTLGRVARRSQWLAGGPLLILNSSFMRTEAMHGGGLVVVACPLAGTASHRPVSYYGAAALLRILSPLNVHPASRRLFIAVPNVYRCVRMRSRSARRSPFFCSIVPPHIDFATAPYYACTVVGNSTP